MFVLKEFLENKKSAWAREREVNSDVQFEVKAKVSKEFPHHELVI